MNHCAASYNGYFNNLRSIFACLLLMTVMPAPALMNDAEISDAELKAAYAYNFTQFISWPDTNINSRFNFCVLSTRAEFQKILSDLNGRKVNEQIIELTFLPEDIAGTDLRSCQLLFQPEPGVASLPTLNKGTVLVAFNPTSNDPRVSITMYFNRDGRLRFSVNQKSLRDSGVKVSSQLLKMASEILGNGQP